MCQGSGPAVPDDAAVVENLPELGRSFLAPVRCQIRLAPNVSGVEAREIEDKLNLPIFDGRQGGPQAYDRGSRVLTVERELRLDRRQPKRLHLRIDRMPFVQILRQRFGSRGVACHGKGKRGFDLRTLTCWRQPQSLCRCLRGFGWVAKGSLAESRILHPDRSVFFVV